MDEPKKIKEERPRDSEIIRQEERYLRLLNHIIDLKTQMMEIIPAINRCVMRLNNIEAAIFPPPEETPKEESTTDEAPKVTDNEQAQRQKYPGL